MSNTRNSGEFLILDNHSENVGIQEALYQRQYCDKLYKKPFDAVVARFETVAASDDEYCGEMGRR